MNEGHQEQETDGFQIALRLIAEEAENKTGFLDLGMLGLTELPDELFQLKHLTGLNLGRYYVLDDKFYQPENVIRHNAIATSLARLCDLPLKHLHGRLAKGIRRYRSNSENNEASRQGNFRTKLATMESHE